MTASPPALSDYKGLTQMLVKAGTYIKGIGCRCSPWAGPCKVLRDLAVCSCCGLPGMKGAALTFANDSFVFLLTANPAAAIKQYARPQDARPET